MSSQDTFNFGLSQQNYTHATITELNPTFSFNDVDMEDAPRASASVSASIHAPSNVVITQAKGKSKKSGKGNNKKPKDSSIPGLDDLEPGVCYTNLPSGWRLPSFSGAPDKSLYKWEEEVCKTFKHSQVRESRWVHFAVQELRALASEWWDNNAAKLNHGNISWTEFIQAMKSSDFHVKQQEQLEKTLENARFDGDYDTYADDFKKCEDLVDPARFPYERLLRLFLKPLPVEHQQRLIVKTSTVSSLRSMVFVYSAAYEELRKIEYELKSQDTKKSASKSAEDGADFPKDQGKANGLRLTYPNNVTAGSSAFPTLRAPSSGDTSPIQDSQINGFGFATAPQPAKVNVSQPLPGGFGSPTFKPSNLISATALTTTQPPPATAQPSCGGSSSTCSFVPRPSLFGDVSEQAAQSSSGGFFGGNPSSLSSSGGLFGSGSSSPSSGGLFGNSSITPTGRGLFGGNSSTASSGGLFGRQHFGNSTSQFGQPPSSLFQQTQQPQVSAGFSFGSTTPRPVVHVSSASPQQQSMSGFNFGAPSSTSIPTGGFFDEFTRAANRTSRPSNYSFFWGAQSGTTVSRSQTSSQTSTMHSNGTFTTRNTSQVTETTVSNGPGFGSSFQPVFIFRTS